MALCTKGFALYTAQCALISSTEVIAVGTQEARVESLSKALILDTRIPEEKGRGHM